MILLHTHIHLKLIHIYKHITLSRDKGESVPMLHGPYYLNHDFSAVDQLLPLLHEQQRKQETMIIDVVPPYYQFNQLRVSSPTNVSSTTENGESSNGICSNNSNGEYCLRVNFACVHI